MPELPINQILQGDCLEVMKTFPDKCIDLILTDPPYGLGEKLHNGGTWSASPIYDNVLLWDKKISYEYFDEIFRISKNQIIWGGHLYNLPIARCWLSWIKTNSLKSMGDFELAWTSFDKPCKAFKEAGNPDGKREHPTQKPLSLFSWILEKYSIETDIICDPFLGSGTTAIAAQYLNRQYIGIEQNPEYIEIANKRLNKKQLRLQF